MNVEGSEGRPEISREASLTFPRATLPHLHCNRNELTMSSAGVQRLPFRPLLIFGFRWISDERERARLRGIGASDTVR